MKRMLCALLALPLLLTAGCGTTRSVQVVDQKAVRDMARRMPAEMQARSLLDSSKSYTSAVFGAADEAYGKILFGRLAPDFLPEGVMMARFRTFKDMTSPRDAVKISQDGFTISTLQHKITVKMIGVLDWEGAGTQSWLVSCLLEPRVGRSRDYYLLIPTPIAERGVLQGKMAAVYECFGMACTMYVHDSAVPTAKAPAADPLSERTQVRESLPGLNQVTAPPQEMKQESALQERSL